MLSFMRFSPRLPRTRFRFRVIAFVNVIVQSTMAEAQRLPASVRDPASVDHQGVPVDVAAFPRIGQKCNGSGDIIGGSESSHWYASREVSIRVAPCCLVRNVHASLYPRWTNAGPFLFRQLDHKESFEPYTKRPWFHFRVHAEQHTAFPQLQHTTMDRRGC